MTTRSATRNIIERARVGNEAELDSLTIGDRHAMFVPYYQNTPIIGRVMADWDPKRPIGCLFLLPLWNPVLAAEHISTLACMTDAPFVVQAGIGSDPRQFAVMGADHSTRGKALDEGIRVVKALLSESVHPANTSASRMQPSSHCRLATSSGGSAAASRELCVGSLARETVGTPMRT